MRKKWWSLVLLVAWLAAVQTASAQYLPSPVGATRLPDPVPIQPTAPLPPMVQGPISPEAAPPGPPEGVDLPASHSSAFQAEEFATHTRVQFNAGAVLLQRNKLSRSNIALVDPNPVQVPARVNVPVLATVDPPAAFLPAILNNVPVPTDVLFTFLGFIDDGRAPPPNAPRAGDFNDIDMPWIAGVRLGFSVFGEESGFEVNGFRTARSGGTVEVVSPLTSTQSTVTSILINQTTPNPNPPVGFPGGTITTFTGSANDAVAATFGPSLAKLALPFVNAPQGFEGNAGLFRQVDAVSIRLESQLSTIESNFRYWARVGAPFELILGARYYEQSESLDYRVADDLAQDFLNSSLVLFPPEIAPFGPTRPGRAPLDLRNRATYTTRVTNRIVGPQLGFESHVMPAPWLILGFQGKATLGMNILQREVSLVRGDGFTGFRTRETINQFGHAYDLGMTADVSLLPGARLRLGYNAFFLCNAATAFGQIDYNLANQNGRRATSETIFYHGPQIELQFLF